MKTMTKAVAARVKRTATLRRRGLSIRLIADALGVSIGIVQRDLRLAKKLGYNAMPPDGKVTGKNGRRMSASRRTGVGGRLRYLATQLEHVRVSILTLADYLDTQNIPNKK